eukprot:s2839_g15.t2
MRGRVWRRVVLDARLCAHAGSESGLAGVHEIHKNYSILDSQLLVPVADFSCVECTEIEFRFMSCWCSYTEEMQQAIFH